MLFSVIIPVYNAEKTIRRCLDSLLESDFNDFEIVCINDGSTDNTAEILAEYSEKYNNVKTYYKEDEGCYKAWKFGLGFAVGKYVLFSDSDDYYDSQIFKHTKSILDTFEYDIIQYSYNVLRNGKLFSKKQISIPDGEYLGDELQRIRTKFYIDYSGVDFPASRWSKVFKREVLLDFLPYSINDARDNEDDALTYPIMQRIQSLFIDSSAFYNYSLNQSSVSRNPSHILKSVEDVENIEKYFYDNKDVFGFSDEMLNRMIYKWNMTIYLNAIRCKNFKLATAIRNKDTFSSVIKEYNCLSPLKFHLLYRRKYRTYLFLSFFSHLLRKH